MLQVRLYLDYIDPGSFLMDRRLAVLEDALGLSVERLAWEVRRPPEPLLDPGDPAWTEYWEVMAAEAAEAGFALHRPTLVPWSRKAHELAFHAREKGCFDKVHRALMDAFHLEGRDVGRVDVLVALGQAAGLEHTETKAVLDVDRHSGTLAQVRDEGARAGVRGVPTLSCGEAVLEGVRSPDEVRVFLQGIMTQGEG
jgi:predicted DsbA family dithiol-disulfide isomerase